MSRPGVLLMPVGPRGRSRDGEAPAVIRKVDRGPGLVCGEAPGAVGDLPHGDGRGLRHREELHDATHRTASVDRRGGALDELDAFEHRHRHHRQVRTAAQLAKGRPVYQDQHVPRVAQAAGRHPRVGVALGSMLQAGDGPQGLIERRGPGFLDLFAVDDGDQERRLRPFLHDAADGLDETG